MEFKTIIATIILEVSRFLFGWWKGVANKKRELIAQENLTKILKVSDTLEQIRRRTTAARVFIVRCNNDGEKIKPGVTWYGTITDETTKDEWEPAKPYFSRLELDQDYKRLVIDLGEKGFLAIRKENTKPGTLLAGVFEIDGVNIAYAYKLKYGPRRQHFLICQFPGTEPGDKTRHFIKTQVAKIKQLMQ